jgi:hypothetical protein
LFTKSIEYQLNASSLAPLDVFDPSMPFVQAPQLQRAKNSTLFYFVYLNNKNIKEAYIHLALNSVKMNPKTRNTPPSSCIVLQLYPSLV